MSTPVPAAADRPSRTHEGTGREPRRTAVLVAVLAAVLLVSMDNSILNVALKTLAEPAPVGLGADHSQLQWAVDAYTLAYAGLLLVSGLLGDRVGHKKLLVAGVALFGVSSALSAYARTPDQLTGLRAVMGVAGSLIMPATLAIISAVFPGERRTKALGIWTAVVGVAVALGPIIGGALLERFWWGSVFLVNVPIVAVALVAMVRFVPAARRSGTSEGRRMDLLGVALSGLGLLGVVYGVIRAGELNDWTGRDAGLPLAAGAVLLAAFVLWERRVAQPALDMRYFRERGFAAAATSLAVLYFALVGGTFVITFYLQSVRGYGPLLTGVCVLPLAASLIIFAPRVPRLVARFGVRAVCTFGLATMAAGLLGLAAVGRSTPIWLFEIWLFVFGTGTAHVHPPSTATVVSTLPAGESGAASAVNNTFRQVGGSLGAAVLGSVLNAAYRSRIDPAVGGLDEGLAERARGSVAATLQVAQDLAAHGHGPQSYAVAQAAYGGFLHAMRTTWLAASVVVLLTTVFVFLVMGPGPSGGAGQAVAGPADGPDQVRGTEPSA
ncbi:MFS transporter [Streptomyces sp. PsTaAH-124]|uniref:MFS transporter n=1 Tax=Streptomyces sp. PsTaAH-124 TaxID=1157638 RepID=UPI00036CFB54|nr:MFS transporter [Streptomyces sp. PsTaAH-124]